MGNLIEDTLNFGFGLFAYSRDQIEKIVQDLVDAGRVERSDAQSFTHKMIKEGEQQRSQVKEMIQGEIRDNLQAIGVAPENQPLTAEQVRQIIREELAANDTTDKNS